MNLSRKELLMDKSLKKQLRSHLFYQLEGIPVVAVISVFSKSGILDFIIQKQKFTLNQVCDKFKCNKGYMAVAMRILCSQGYVKCAFEEEEALDFSYVVLDKGIGAFKYSSVFEKYYSFYSLNKDISQHYHKPLSTDTIESIEKLCELLDTSDEILGIQRNEHLISNIRGAVIGSLMVHIGTVYELSSDENGTFIRLKDDDLVSTKLLRCLEVMNWGMYDGDKFRFTEEGEFFVKRSSAYGVTVSYLQTFIWLEELIFGKGDILWDRPEGSHEIHVDRRMNVWGSGGAHAVYFDRIDDIIKEVFNRPLDEQPKGIADMGCGNAAFLIHLYETISKHTLRGKHFDSHPLLIIGSDFNEEAIDSSKRNLKSSGIEGHFIKGDIGDPEQLAMELERKFGVSLGEMLNVRSFLDHNRVFELTKSEFDSRDTYGTGAYSFRGRLIDNREIEQNLLEHFLKWKPFVEKFGLLVIELHTINPNISSKNIGKTAISAYDATHGFTDQYIVEHEVFIKIAKEAGLSEVLSYQSLFPNEMMTTVSINLLKEHS